MNATRVILDTDLLSEAIKSVDPTVVRRAQAYRLLHGRLTFTSATVMEILYGLGRKQAYVQIRLAEETFRSNEEIVPTSNDYRLAAEIMSALDRQGTPIGRIDPLIAACALNRDLALATGNLRHFGDVVEAGFPLRTEDWRAA